MPRPCRAPIVSWSSERSPAHAPIRTALSRTSLAEFHRRLIIEGQLDPCLKAAVEPVGHLARHARVRLRVFPNAA
eukprot:scaffold6138_cov105-Isochrysis_galbana.AAC.2